MKEYIAEHKVIAILRDFPVEKTLDAVQALYDGGIRMLEVALNSPQALVQIEMLHKQFKNRILIGAGTAITIERIEGARAAGAQFLLTPSVREEILAYCQKEKLKLLPGVMTPSDVDLCLHYGYSTLKLFPAGDLSENYIQSLKGPFDNTDYVAVGGVDAHNANEFIARGFVGVGIGSSLISKQAMQQSDWSTVSHNITQLFDTLS